MRNNTLITLLLSVFIALLGIGIIVAVMPIFAQKLAMWHMAQLDRSGKGHEIPVKTALTGH